MRNKPFPNYEVPQFATISELLELTKEKYGEKIIFRTTKKKGDEIMSSDTKWSNEYSSGLN